MADVECPETVGPYRILERIGKGGFGTVYLAEQTEPVRRKVAVKLINPGMDSEEILARFAAERETLNLMNHPGIARLLDAGATERGTPYFVMEYVPGAPIHEYAQRNKLDVPARLALFAMVCEAVQHAHQKGVIHRDLSSNNVLVTEIDGAPVIKIIDFGIAKSLTQGHGSSPVHTMQGQSIGTPEFMSPEQAMGRTAEIDTRSDIYALGVQLYQLLTDTLPFPRLRQGGSLLMEKVISDDVAESPSTRVAKVPARDAAHRAETQRRARTLRGELDWITAKAMDKERDRRYPSVASLAGDVRLYLDGQAVTAGPPSTMYRARKFLRRNRGLVLAGVAVFVSLVVGLIVALMQYSRAEQEAARAENEAARAEAALDLAERRLASADLIVLERLRDRVAALGPEVPASVSAYRAWLADAKKLAAHLPEHEKRLAEFEAAGATGGDQEFMRDAADIVRELREFAHDQGGAIHDVEQRLRWVNEMRAATIEKYAAAWQRCRDELGADPRFGALAAPLEPQLGLVPLGKDPVSGLQEFALPRSGAVPVRGDDGALQLGDDVAIVLVLLPGGPFAMGAQNEDPKGPNYDPIADGPEAPVHQVVLAPFFLGKYETTQAQWKRLSGANPSRYSSDKVYSGAKYTPRHPVETVTWIDADRTVRRFGLALPTEAQWEYACRSGQGTPWWSGDDVLAIGDVANVADQAAIKGGADWPSLDPDLPLDDGHHWPAPVGAYRANAFGLHDMHGNLFEWCAEWFFDGAYHLPCKPGTGERFVSDELGRERVIRGGSFFSAPLYSRASYRWKFPPDGGSDNIGVRVARRL